MTLSDRSNADYCEDSPSEPIRDQPMFHVEHRRETGVHARGEVGSKHLPAHCFLRSPIAETRQLTSPSSNPSGEPTKWHG